MKAPTAFDNFPPFAENGQRQMSTESAKYSVGFSPADTFPAEWANFLFHGSTKGISDLNTAVTSVWQEAANVVTESGQTPDATRTNQLYTAIQTFINNAVLAANQQVLNQAKLDAHPVGSLYWSSDPTNPATLFGGTWTQIKDRFVWAKGDNDTVNATGGEKSHTLSVSEMPSHNHTFTGTAKTVSVSGASHSHAVPTGSRSETDEGWGGRVDPNRGSWGTSGNQTSTTSSGSLSMSGSYTPSGSIGYKGSTSSHNNMPPYLIKYCWERIS